MYLHEINSYDAKISPASVKNNKSNIAPIPMSQSSHDAPHTLNSPTHQLFFKFQKGTSALIDIS